jgi:hypothetical protein
VLGVFIIRRWWGGIRVGRDKGVVVMVGFCVARHDVAIFCLSAALLLCKSF